MAHHHDRLFEALFSEVEELSLSASNHELAHELSTKKKLWSVSGALGSASEEVRRRSMLRDCVQMVRIARRAASTQIISSLTYPERLFSEWETHHRTFALSPDDAADRALDLLLRYDAHLRGAKRLQRLREKSDPPGHSRAAGHDAIELSLARRAGEVWTDLQVATWRAGGMTWRRFVSIAAEIKTAMTEKFIAMRGHAGIDAALDAMESVDLSAESDR